MPQMSRRVYVAILKGFITYYLIFCDFCVILFLVRKDDWETLKILGFQYVCIKVQQTQQA